MAGDPAASAAWRSFRARVDLDEYDSRWDRLAAAGQNVHGEADLVAAYQPATVLDAGCGTGRVAIELARRGVAVVGVDADADMIERARRRAPELTWIVADLAELDLGASFDVVVMAGNVLPFVEPSRRADAVTACARHLRPGGRLVSGAGYQDGWATIDDYDAWCSAAGLELAERFAGWDREPWVPGGSYAVSVARRSPTPP